MPKSNNSQHLATVGNHRKPPNEETGGQKVAGSNPVAPTYKPFRDNELRKGLFYGVIRVFWRRYAGARIGKEIVRPVVSDRTGAAGLAEIP